jgi:hypothetical protein
MQIHRVSPSTGLAVTGVRTPTLLTVGRRPTRPWWRTVGADVARLLFFLFGPADIGPLEPSAARPVLVPAPPAPYITVIPVR